jgi:hypothetical protein
MVESIILILTTYWFLSFFAQPHAICFTDTLSIVIVVLIAVRISSRCQTMLYRKTVFCQSKTP